MCRSLDRLKDTYKPYKITIKGNTKIFESTSKNIVIKHKNKDLKKLFNYLESRSFNGFPKILDEDIDDYDVYEYIEDIDTPKEQKIGDLIDIMAHLHLKTSYYKEVSEDDFKLIYENINNNILYLKDYYNNLFDNSYLDIYMSPSKYLFMINYTKINSTLDFCKEELNKWYNLVNNSKKQRVSIVHNNLNLSHYITSDKGYLISWDKYLIDTPILDIINLYKNEYYNTNFEPLLKRYLDIFPLNEDELKLLFITISLPYEINFNNKELYNTTEVSKLLDYIYKTEQLLRPYYTKE